MDTTTAPASSASSATSATTSFVLAPFFLNILVLNKEDVVAAKVQEKVGTGYFGIMAKLAAGAANMAVSDDKFMVTITSKLIEAIPAKVADMGISLEVKTSFQQGSFVVLRAQVKAIDFAVLLKKVKGDEFASKFTQLLDLLDFFQAKEPKANVQQKVHGLVQDALLNKLEEILPNKLQEGNVSVSVTTKRDSEQAEFFFDFLSTTAAK